MQVVLVANDSLTTPLGQCATRGRCPNVCLADGAAQLQGSLENLWRTRLTPDAMGDHPIGTDAKNHPVRRGGQALVQFLDRQAGNVYQVAMLLQNALGVISSRRRRRNH